MLIDFGVMLFLLSPIIITAIICYTVYKLKELKSEEEKENVRDN